MTIKKLFVIIGVFGVLGIEERIILTTPTFLVVSTILSITLLLGIFIGLWEMAHDR